MRGILSSFFRTKRERKRAISQLPPLLSPLLTIFEKERENREGERRRGRENNSCDLGEIIQNVFFFFVEKIKCGRFETKTINQSDSAIRKRRLVHWKYRPVVRHLRHVKRQTTAGGETKLKHKSRVEVYDRNIPSGS